MPMKKLFTMYKFSEEKFYTETISLYDINHIKYYVLQYNTLKKEEGGRGEGSGEGEGRILVSCYSVDEHWQYHPKWNKPVTKSNTIWFHLFKVPKVLKLIETVYNIVVSCGWDEGEMGSCLIVIKFQFYKMEKFWRSIAQQSEYT